MTCVKIYFAITCRFKFNFMKTTLIPFITSCLLILLSCNTVKKEQKSLPKEVVSANLLIDFSPKYNDGDINAVIEIPAGTLQKWEVNKNNGQLEWDKIDGVPRVINYLSYPGNYGMIPKTLLSKEQGGDGDPLDVIVLGESVKRGVVVKSKLIGVMYLIDKGEQDDKLIAVAENSPLYKVSDITELNKSYNGVSEILKLWFTNYKGVGKMEFKGFGNKQDAEKILQSAVQQYSEQYKE